MSVVEELHMQWLKSGKVCFLHAIQLTDTVTDWFLEQVIMFIGNIQF